MMKFPLERQKIRNPINQKISFLKVLGEEKADVFIPIIFCLHTYNGKYYRFFIDAWLLNWVDYDYSEMKKIVDEDFEEYDSYKTKNLMLDYNLTGRMIKNIEMDYIETPKLLIGKLLFEIEGNITLLLVDYGDQKEQELNILFNSENLFKSQDLTAKP